MTDQEFFKGWTMLLVQPWARMYTYGDDAQAKERVQIGLYKCKFERLDGWRWIFGCQDWVEQQDHWPTMSELEHTIKRAAPLKPAPVLALPGHSSGGHAPDDYPPRLAYEYAKAHHLTMREACLKLMPIWLRDHPTHPERERVEALLAVMHEKPTPRRHDMPTLTEEPKYEWSTDLKADGCRGVCPKCHEPSQIYVCWCEREACKACLAQHLPQCTQGKIVQEA